MAAKTFAGIVVPMITPLQPDLTIDRAAVRRLMTRFAENDIDPLVLGTTGESSSIGAKESLAFVQAAVEAKGEQQLVYAGLVGNQLDELLDRGNRYLALGADAVVATLPSYYTLTPEQMHTYYNRLADGLRGPLFLYNIKATTQMSLPLEIVDSLSHHPNIFGLKDSERDEARLRDCISRYKDRADFSYFCGWGAQSAGSLALGADGIVPSTGNLVPELYQALYTAALDGDFDRALDLQNRTDLVAMRYQKDKTLGQSLAALKLLMHAQGLCGTTMMPPLTELTEAETRAVLNL